MYYFSLFKAPISVIKTIEKKMRNFLWGGSNCSHLIKWDTVFAAKERGGLEVLNLRFMNISLLAKWCWRFGVEKNQFWYKLIVEKYGSDVSYWVPATVNSPYGISCWRAIAEASEMINNNSTLCIHSGELISFWHDKWIGNTSLVKTFNLLYKLDNLQFGNLADHISLDGSWKFNFKRAMNNAEVIQFANLLTIIGSNPPNIDNLPDTRRWTLHPSGSFTVQSLYKTFTAVEGMEDFPYQFVWATGIPPNVSFLLWCAVHGKLNSKDMLNYKGMDIYSSCILCGDSSESQEHLLIHCKVANYIWNVVTPKENWAWVFPENLFSLAHTWQNNKLSQTGRVVWDLIPAAVIWVLWRERNCRTFEEQYKFKTDQNLAIDVKSLVLSWATTSGNRVHLNFSNSVLHWETVFT